MGAPFMPRPTPQPPPSLAALYEELAGREVENLPLPSASVPERELASLLAFSLFYAERLKKVRFPLVLDWSAPSFDVVDDKLTVRVAWARLDGLADLAAVLRDVAAREADAVLPVVLALDALDAEASEFELEHALYGEVVLLDFRVRAPASRDARVERARERGWAGVLKEHNLLPGRGLFVPDDQQGLFLTEPAAQHLSGVQLLLPSGHFTMELNPFVREDKNDPDLQYWLAWGRGGAASEWRDVLAVSDDPDAP